jgi:hypothetical protein
MEDFWAFVVNCDFESNSTVIKTAKCIVTKYRIVRILFIVEYNLSIKLKNHPFSDLLLYPYENFVLI